MKIVRIDKIIFTNKQKIPWDDVFRYAKQYEGTRIVVREYDDEITFNHTSASEFASSVYSKGLKGAVAKAKANLVQVIPELIEYASNRRWTENKDEKHSKDANRGWYRYDVRFEISVMAPETNEQKWNQYIGTLIVRINDKGLFFYDVVNIKKETRTPGES